LNDNVETIIEVAKAVKCKKSKKWVINQLFFYAWR
jgi:hypothetical protein